MTREYDSPVKLTGWYYDLQTDPTENRLTCVSLHPNSMKVGEDWDEIKDGIDEDDDIACYPKNKYRKKPICTAIVNEDFSVSISNSWSDFGGDMLGQMWDSIKPLAPYAGAAQNAIERAVEQYKNLDRSSTAYKNIQESKLSMALEQIAERIVEKDENGNYKTDIAEYLNRSLVIQGTRFSYYSGTGTSFGSLNMKFTIFPKWEGNTFITVNKQVEEIFPYVMGEYVLEHFDTIPDLDGMVGWQKPPAGFKADTKFVDNIQFGTLKLKIGPYFSLTNLVCENATFTYSKQMVKRPKGSEQETASDEPFSDLISPFYCEVSLQLKPATKYSEKSVKNFVYGRCNERTLCDTNDKLIGDLNSEMGRLSGIYDGVSKLF